MTAKQFIKSKGLKPVKRLSTGKETGEYLLTIEQLEEFSESIKSQEEFKNLEYTLDKNMEIVSSFMEHYKTETGKEINEKIFLSFFNA